MEPEFRVDTASVSWAPPHNWAQLIRKLRWIGLEEEAKRLEAAVSALPPKERGSVCVGPFSTD
jgi:hypothetical protein